MSFFGRAIEIPSSLGLASWISRKRTGRCQRLADRLRTGPVLDQVPLVAIQVPEDGNDSVFLIPRRLDELHSAGEKGPVIPMEVISLEEESHSAAGLVPDGCLLCRIARAAENDGSITVARWGDEDP